MLHVYMCGGECCSYWGHWWMCVGFIYSPLIGTTRPFFFFFFELLPLWLFIYWQIYFLLYVAPWFRVSFLLYYLCQSLSTHGLVWVFYFYFVALGTSWLVSGRVHCVWFSTRSPEGTRICSRPHCQHCDRRYICTTSVSVSSVNAFLMLQCFLCMQLRCFSWCHLRHIGPFAQPHQLAQHRAVRRRQFISQLLQRTRTQICSQLLTPADS